LLGVIGDFGVVTGGGSKAACDSVFTASKFRERMVAYTAGIASDLGDNRNVWEFRGSNFLKGHRAMVRVPREKRSCGSRAGG
jgi:hypothetical protein